MHFHSFALAFGISLATVTGAHPFVPENADTKIEARAGAPVIPFRYFKLRDDSNATIMQQIRSPSENAALWEGGPDIAHGEFPSWPPIFLDDTSKLIISFIST